MALKNRSVEVFSLSFLDVISCGFGAMILLLVLVLALEPLVLEKIANEQQGDIDEQKAAIETAVAEIQSLQQEIDTRNDALQDAKQELQALTEQWAATQSEESAGASQVEIESQLQAVLQQLTTEMQNLRQDAAYKPPDSDALIGGIPVDSEYIIFIIDTSGSMRQLAWPTVMKKVEEVLSIYPNVKGIQILNDMGRYMFGAYSGRWIPDTPARRKEVLRQLRTWNSYSNSSPVEGITHAVRHYLRDDRKISLYVFGDDFSSGSIDAVINEVARYNRKERSGRSQVRIHAFGFPVLYGAPAYDNNRTRFAHLMRLLAEQNSGSFVGLTVLE